MKRVVIVAAVALAACSTHSGIVNVGDGTYMVANQTSMTWSGSSVKIDLMKDANAHCATMGKKAKFLRQQHTDAQAYTTYAAAELQFTCE